MADTFVAKPIRRHVGNPKSRSGCFSCRYVSLGNLCSTLAGTVASSSLCHYLLLDPMHIKCDERKPQCLRCIRAGRACSYQRVGAIDRTSLRQIVPKLRLIPKNGAWKRSFTSLAPDETGVENRYFRYFQEGTAPDLAGPFNEAIWTRLILQACQHEPFVKHGVIAIAALDKSQ